VGTFNVLNHEGKVVYGGDCKPGSVSGAEARVDLIGRTGFLLVVEPRAAWVVRAWAQS
jgi:hypothetical protein